MSTPERPEHRHEIIDGLEFCNRPELHQPTFDERTRARQTPGSVYYPGAPPDDDDPWQWCHVCKMWHPHGPCF